ncbi:MAG: hypothetical protein LBH82_06380 [Bacteroidales bacterium]|nr:hypothetical protein [Bacteroidales bacterium]
MINIKTYILLLSFLTPAVIFSQEVKPNSSDSIPSFDFWLLKTPDEYVKEDLKKPVNFSYMKNLQAAIKYIMDNDTLTNYEMLLKAIPETNAEFAVYFACDYEQNEIIRTAWGKLDQIILKSAMKDKEIFVLYLKLSEFVDGYYAEGYFDDVEYLIENNKSYFCSIYSTLNSDCKLKLSDYAEFFCE